MILFASWNLVMPEVRAILEFELYELLIPSLLPTMVCILATSIVNIGVTVCSEKVFGSLSIKCQG